VAGCIEAYDEQINTAKGDVELSSALLNRCTIALDTEDYQRVRDLCNRIIDLKVREGDAWHILAMLEYRLANHEDAITLFDKALERGASNAPLVHWNKSLPLHSIGRYREGWQEHGIGGRTEVTVQAIFIPHHRFTLPLWRGEGPVFEESTGQMKDRPETREEMVKLRPTVLHVHTEAGHGDNIAIIRYLPILAKQGYVVRYECDPLLIDLVRLSMPEIEVMPRAADYPGALGVKPFDYHVPIGDIAGIVGTDIDSVPWEGPYLRADPDLRDLYRQRLDRVKGRKIGLCWSAGIRRNMNIWMERYGKMKSMHFKDIDPVVRAIHSRGDIAVSLQVGDGRNEHPDGYIASFLPESPIWLETAALVANLDLVITVDTAVAHLAGAMGKPVWVLTQRNATSWHFMCWRPGASWNEASPWYPSARVFRQHSFEKLEWAGAVADVAKAIAEVTFPIS
jgi:hypothetical protein